MKNKLLFFTKGFLFIGAVLLLSGIGNLVEKSDIFHSPYMNSNLAMESEASKQDSIYRSNASVADYDEFVAAVEDQNIERIILENDIKIDESIGASINGEEQIILRGVHDLDGQGHKIYYEGARSLQGSLISGDPFSTENAYFSSIKNLEISNIGSFIGDQYIKNYSFDLSVTYSNLLIDNINYQANLKSSMGLLTNHFWIFLTNDSIGAMVSFSFNNIYIVENEINISLDKTEINDSSVNFSLLVGEILAITPTGNEKIKPLLRFDFYGIFIDKNTIDFNLLDSKAGTESEISFSLLSKFNLLWNDATEASVELEFRPHFTNLFIQNNVVESNNKAVKTYLLFDADFNLDAKKADTSSVEREYILSSIIVLNNTFKNISFHEWIYDLNASEEDTEQSDIYYFSPTYKSDFYIKDKMYLFTYGFDLINESEILEQIKATDYLLKDSSLYNTIEELLTNYFDRLEDSDNVLKTSFIPIYESISNTKETLMVSRFSAKFASVPNNLENWKNTINYNRQKNMVTFEYKFSLNLGITFNKEKVAIEKANLYSSNQLVAKSVGESEVDRNNNYALTFDFIEKINFETFIYSDLQIDIIFANQDITSILKENSSSNFFVIPPLSKDDLNLKKNYFLEMNVIILLSLLLLLFFAIILAIIFRLHANKKRAKKTKEEIFINKINPKRSFKKQTQKRIDYQPKPLPVINSEAVSGEVINNPKYLTSGNLYQTSGYVDYDKNEKQKVSQKWNRENNQYESFKDYNQYSSDDYYHDYYGAQYDESDYLYNENQENSHSVNQTTNLNNQNQEHHPILNENIYTLDEYDEWEDFDQDF